ncbi:hypothetical protein SDC9_202235 [bioreactor metagenome]|uniref:AraC effector-binding domain-containing protein n=1 Tax=bioreactor metagenome TaxID=1076179 RepID=A0A645J241_9ZZZZ
MDGTIPRLAGLINAQPAGILGVSACGGPPDSWRYYIAAASTLPAEGLEEFTVPASTWAIFPGEGNGISIQELERRIVSDWLPNSGYEYASAPDVEVYLDPDPANTRYEVWIPVVKKQA